jgi:hypothetical protein
MWQQAIAAATRVRPLGYDAKTHTVPVDIDGHIRLFDTRARALAPARPEAPALGSANAAVTGDGRLYYGSGTQVIELNLASGAVKPLARAPAAVNNITATDERVYISVGIDVYTLRITRDRSGG